MVGPERTSLGKISRKIRSQIERLRMQNQEAEIERRERENHAKNVEELTDLVNTHISKTVTNQEFIDRNSISNLITASHIKRYFSSHQNTTLRYFTSQRSRRAHNPPDPSHFDLISESAPKLFMLLVLCSKQDWIFDLLRAGIRDSSLPFKLSDVPEYLTDKRPGPRDTNHDHIEISATDKQRIASTIVDKQRLLEAPVFTQGRHYDFAVQTILPFLTLENIGKGVDKVKVHAAHFETRGSSSEDSSFKDRIVARKRVSKEKMVEFQREKEALESLLSASHRNLVELFATYTIESESDPYILMSCGDMDLDGLFKKKKAPACFGKSDEEQGLTVWHALPSLASALAHLHHDVYVNGLRQIILHLDIKPGNVIIRGSTFQLADFGLASLKSPEDTKTQWHGETYDYSPPEYFTWRNSSGQPDFRHLCDRKSDVWSLGCVFSELATLAIMGWKDQDVSKFKTSRRDGVNQRLIYSHTQTDSSFHHNQDEVHSWLKMLEEKSPERSEVFKIVKKMIHATHSERSDSRSVEDDLKAIFPEFLNKIAI
ncbi:MAG: hypothetical protein HETSPECPRED_001458 [Heterodermia speciosa]|uniref:non-specific serine/threonine protein kinase n=1 Tax=Heterodermia speciosa TaxID=116794 RepID=A0A8H3J1K1_9LECA|nr:MAG: hypothetical protein HETSPECPRED_001458 [Heterodermia speciosa]